MERPDGMDRYVFDQNKDVLLPTERIAMALERIATALEGAAASGERFDALFNEMVNVDDKQMASDTIPAHIMRAMEQS